MAKITKGRRDKRPKKDSYPKYWFYFEGLTEWHYFNSFKKNLRGVDVVLYMKKPVEGRSKSRLVESAVKDTRYHGIEESDRVFVVFDMDAPYDVVDYEMAVKMAQDNNIELFISDDAFELWPLLHFRDVTSSMSREELEAELSIEMKNHFGKKYKKPCPDLFDILAGAPDLANEAIKRAKKLPTGQNPSTNVYELVELLQGLRK